MLSRDVVASALFTAVAAAGLLDRSDAPAGAVIVDQSAATPCSFTTVQAAVDSLDVNSTTPKTLFIYPGTYYEQVLIPALMFNLTVQGSTNDSSTYAHNTATITYNQTRMYTTSNDLAATLRVHTSNVKFYNLNIENTWGPHVDEGGQNLVVSADESGQGYYGMQFLGYQDTIQANEGYQLYAKCLIVGAIDFIYGQRGSVLVDNSDIRINGPGYITASGRTYENVSSWYVVSQSTVDSIDYDTVPAGSTFLGRPWRAFARAVFQNTYLGDVVNATGWKQWSDSKPNIANATFAEFNNTGPGSIAEVGIDARANFTQQFDSAMSAAAILGDGFADEFWVDEMYMTTL